MGVLADVQSAFLSATSLNALSLAGLIIVISVGLGSVVGIAWAFGISRRAKRATFSALQSLVLVIAAFVFLMITLGVLYD